MEPEKLTDDSIMECGKHKGKKMSDVPDDWYVWVYNDHCKNRLKYMNKKMGPVIAYIIRNFDRLQANYAMNTKKNFDYKNYFKKGK